MASPARVAPAVGLVGGVPGESGASYDGAALFERYCASCHTPGSSFGRPAAAGGGGLGPPLRRDTLELQFPTAAQEARFVADGSDWHEGYGRSGLGTGRMPGFCRVLLPAQVGAIVEYERSLPPASAERSPDDAVLPPAASR